MPRSVLVTGANSGVGLATALHLAGQGFEVVGSVRSDDKAELLAKAAWQADVRVEPVLLDVRDAQACERVVAGRELYGLVNNAGYFNAGAIADVPSTDAREQLETMLLAPMRLAQLALPAMRDAGEGRIVNVSSGIVHLTGGLTGWYQASKHGLTAVSDALRMEVASLGVDVVLIEPGGIETAIWDNAEADLLRRRQNALSPQGYDRALRLLRRLRGHMHPPEEVAHVIGSALTDERPRARYRVGLDAGALRWANLAVPAGIRDRLVRAVLGL